MGDTTVSGSRGSLNLNHYQEHWALSTTRKVSYVVVVIFVALGATGAALTQPGTVLFYVSVSGGGAAVVALLPLAIWSVTVTIMECRKGDDATVGDGGGGTVDFTITRNDPSPDEGETSVTEKDDVEASVSKSEETKEDSKVEEGGDEDLTSSVDDTPKSEEQDRDSSISADEELEIGLIEDKALPYVEPEDASSVWAVLGAVGTGVGAVAGFMGKTAGGFLGLHGAELQKRNYTFLMVPLLDTLIEFLDDEDEIRPEFLSIADKVAKAKELLGADEDLAFLLDPEEAKKFEFKHAFYQVFHFLLSLDTPTYPRQSRRYYFMTALEALISTEVYQKAVLKILRDEATEDDELYIKQTKIILSLIYTMFTDVNINALSEEALKIVLKDGITKAFQDEDKGVLDAFTEYVWGDGGMEASVAPKMNCGQEDVLFENRGTKVEADKQEAFNKIIRHLGLPESLLNSEDVTQLLTLAHDAALCFKAINASSETSSKAFTDLNRARGHLNILFYPLMVNNFISTLWGVSYSYDGDGGKKYTETNCLRFGSPTAEGVTGGPVILNSFLGWLDQLAIKKERVVSFQHQNPQNKGSGKGSEKARLDKMFEIPTLQDDRYSDTYFPIGLPMDGDWYQQTGIYASKSQSYKDFMTAYLGFLRGTAVDAKLKTSPYRIDWDQLAKAGLDKETVMSEIKAQLNKMHQLYFEGKGDLSVLDRQMFITFSYTFIEEYFILALGADHYHSQCKDAQDRAMTLMILTRWRDMVRSGDINVEAKRVEFRALIHFAGLFIKGTPMHGGEHKPINGRAKRFLETLHYLEMRILGDEELIQNGEDQTLTVNGTEYTFYSATLSTTPNQTVEKLPSEAKTPDEYKAALGKDKRSTVSYTLPNEFYGYYQECTFFCKHDMDKVSLIVEDKSVRPDKEAFDASINDILNGYDSAGNVKAWAQHPDYLDPLAFFVQYDTLVQNEVTKKGAVIEAYQEARFKAFSDKLIESSLDLDILDLANHEMLDDFVEPILNARYSNTALEITLKPDRFDDKASIKIEVIGKRLYVTRGYVIEGLEDNPLYVEGSFVCNTETWEGTVTWTTPKAERWNPIEEDLLTGWEVTEGQADDDSDNLWTVYSSDDEKGS